MWLYIGIINKPILSVALCIRERLPPNILSRLLEVWATSLIPYLERWLLPTFRQPVCPGSKMFFHCWTETVCYQLITGCCPPPAEWRQSVRFEVGPLKAQKSLYLATPLAFKPPPQRTVSAGTTSIKFSLDVDGWPRYQKAKKNCRKFQLAE